MKNKKTHKDLQSMKTPLTSEPLTASFAERMKQEFGRIEGRKGFLGRLARIDNDLRNLKELMDSVRSHIAQYEDIRGSVEDLFRDIYAEQGYDPVDIKSVDAVEFRSLIGKLKSAVSVFASVSAKAKKLKDRLSDQEDSVYVDVAIRNEACKCCDELEQMTMRIKRAVEMLNGTIANKVHSLKTYISADINNAKKAFGDEFQDIMGNYGGNISYSIYDVCGGIAGSGDVPERIIREGEKIVEQAISELTVDFTTQPPLSMLGRNAINDTLYFPKFLVLGSDEVEFHGRPYFKGKSKVITIPHLVPFPFKSHMVYEREDYLLTLLLRMTFAMPFGRFDITVLDSMNYGECVKRISALADINNILRRFTNSGEVSAELSAFDGYLGKMVKDGIFSDKIPSWTAYNRWNPTEPLPYRVIVVASLCDVSSIGFSALKKILQAGNRAGVLVIVSKKAIDECNVAAKRGVDSAEAVAKMSYIDLDNLIVTGEL